MGSCLGKLSICRTEDRDNTTRKYVKEDHDKEGIGDNDIQESDQKEDSQAELNHFIANDTDQTSPMVAISGNSAEHFSGDLQRPSHVQLTARDLAGNKPEDQQTDRNGRKCLEPRYTEEKESLGPNSSMFPSDPGEKSVECFESNLEYNTAEIPNEQDEENNKQEAFGESMSLHGDSNGVKSKPKTKINVNDISVDSSKKKTRQDSPNSSETNLKTASNTKVKGKSKTRKNRHGRDKISDKNFFVNTSSTKGSSSSNRGSSNQRVVQSTSDSSDESDSSETESDSESSTDSEEEEYPTRRGHNKSSSAKVYSAVNMQFGKGNKIINQKIKKYSSDSKNASSKRKHKHKKKTRETDEETGKHFIRSPNFSLDSSHIETIRSREIVVEAAKSVGIIRGPKANGTGFRVGPHYVMTAYHVVKNWIDGNGNIMEKFQKDLHIQFDYLVSHRPYIPSKNFLFKPNILYQNSGLDTAVLELDIKTDETKELPPPLLVFGSVSNNLYLVGHSNGDVLQDDAKLDIWPRNEKEIREAEEWSITNFGKNGYFGMNDPNRILFHTAFAHGASGAPGMHIDEGSGTSVVTTMLLRGYPDFCYTKELPKEQIAKIKNVEKIEQGISMYSIWLDMKDNGHDDLSIEIFGYCFAEGNPRDKSNSII